MADSLRTRLGAAMQALRGNLPTQPDRGTVFNTTPRQAMRPVDEAATKNPQHIVSILREADVGQTRRLIDLGKSSRKKDSRLDGVSAMRVTVIGSRRWVIKPAVGHEKDKLHLRRCAAVTQMLGERQVRFRANREHLAHGVLEPHAVLEHAWYVTQVSTTVDGVSQTESVWNSAPVWRHPRRFVWNDAGHLAKCDPGVDGSQGIPLGNYPGKFIVHTPIAGRSDYPWMRGALRSRLIGSIAKRSGVTWWLQALERYGQPQVFAKLNTGDSNLVDEALRSLRSIGTDWRAVVPEGVTFDSIKVDIQSDLHQRFVDWQNVEDAVLILGQNLSTEVKGGSFAAAMSQERVRADILASDITELDETTNDQHVALLWHYNWPGEPVGYIETQLSAATPYTLADYQAGICTADEYRMDNGHDPEPDGKGDRYFVAPAAQTFTMTQTPPSGGGPAALPFSATPTASPTSSTLQPPTHPLRSALLRR